VDDLSFTSIPIIFENDEIVVLNKPQGLLSIEDGYHPELPNLRSILKNHYVQIWTVHRLDKETSGVIIFAKHAETHKFLNIQFSNRQVIKKYQAIARGFPVWKEKTIDFPLRPNGDRKHRTVIDIKNGKRAKTHLQVKGKSESLSRLEVLPATGYTHQIRAHCAAVGLPLLGDQLYFRGCEIESLNDSSQLFLHAMSLEIATKPNEKSRFFFAPPPQHFLDQEKSFS
jgi:RluA family pseudouridine synthase